MKISNSIDYNEAPLEITAQDLAIIFDELDFGVKTQMKIANDIWEYDRWILQEQYKGDGKKKSFIQAVLYQVNYLYHKEEIDDSLWTISDNAKELGYEVDIFALTEDFYGISKYFKRIWIQLKFVNKYGYTRTKIRTILKQYNYKRRTEKFFDHVIQCMKFYGIQAYEKGLFCDIRKASLDIMITLKLIK